MNEALVAMQNSMKVAKDMAHEQIVEDNVDMLIKKLEGHGKRVKIIESNEEDDTED